MARNLQRDAAHRTPAAAQLLAKQIRLIDYETIIEGKYGDTPNESPKRLVAFGKFAG